MDKTIATWAVGVTFISLCTGVVAEALPKKGAANIQVIFKGSTMTKFNSDYSHGGATGVTFNEKGKGFLHLGKVACSFSNFSRKEINKGIGFCNFQDKDGNELFVQYSGDSKAKGEFSGVTEIIGGTGKFTGISGSGSFVCANTDKESEFPCTEKFDYQLPE